MRRGRHLHRYSLSSSKSLIKASHKHKNCTHPRKLMIIEAQEQEIRPVQEEDDFKTSKYERHENHLNVSSRSQAMPPSAAAMTSPNFEQDNNRLSKTTRPKDFRYGNQTYIRNSGNSTRTDYNVQLLMIGETGVGKSSLLHRYKGGEFKSEF